MNVNDIISDILPLNTKEKVDSLILKMKENHIIMTFQTKMTIRTAIRKVSIQEYFIERYDGGISDKEIEDEQKLQRRAERERNKIRDDRKKSLLPHELRTKKEVKKRKTKTTTTPETTKIRYKGSVARTIRIFGPNYLDFNQKRKEGNKIAQAGHPKKSNPISTTKSVHTISIASGGMNKRH